MAVARYKKRPAADSLGAKSFLFLSTAKTHKFLGGEKKNHPQKILTHKCYSNIVCTNTGRVLVKVKGM